MRMGLGSRICGLMGGCAGSCGGVVMGEQEGREKRGSRRRMDGMSRLRGGVSECWVADGRGSGVVLTWEQVSRGILHDLGG